VLVREYKESDLDALRAIHAAQGFDYALPDLRNPLFLTKLVLSDENVALSGTCSGLVGDASPGQACHSEQRADAIGPPSRYLSSSRDDEANNKILRASEIQSERREGNSRILGAAFLRLTAEAYLLLDPRAGTPRERWQWLLALHEAARRDAWRRGLEDVHAWLPPPIAQKFGRRLARLGWRRDDAWTPYCTRLSVE